MASIMNRLFNWLWEGDNFDSGSPSISSLVPITCAASAPTIAIAANNMPALTENKQNKCALLEKIENYNDLPTPPKDGERGEIVSHQVTASELLSDTVSNHNLRKIDEDFELMDLPRPPSRNDNHSSDIVNDRSPRKKHLSTNKKINGNQHQEVDLDSIESISECKHSYSEQDIPDATIKAAHLDYNLGKEKKKNKRSASKSDDEEEDDAVVKCLYYTLVCCDCTIS